jgi:PPK2 family polyphosphate:nucleotide phosphotransferase
MKFDLSDYQVKHSNSLSLKDYNTRAPGEIPADIEKQVLLTSEKLAAFQNKLYAENRQSLLIIFQGMDASGKDSAIRKIMAGVNPQGVMVHSFKHPSNLELSHDYLWRHYITLPEQGQIAIFNRSHYENVLISRVHPELVLAERIPGIEKTSQANGNFWKERYKQIRNFEETIHQNGTQILKFFLHLSKDEQKKRFLERIEKKDKHWKFSASDIQERGYWKEYQKAYEKAIEKTSTKENPWFIIPADDKWFTQWVITKIILGKLKSMKMKYPVPTDEQIRRLEDAKVALLSEEE